MRDNPELSSFSCLTRESINLCPDCHTIYIEDLSYHCECGASVLRPEANPAGWGRTAAGDPICKSCRDEAEYLEGVRLENIEREWKEVR